MATLEQDADCSRAELGRAAWKVLHLMTLRYPEVCILLSLLRFAFASATCDSLT